MNTNLTSFRTHVTSDGFLPAFRDEPAPLVALNTNLLQFSEVYQNGTVSLQCVRISNVCGRRVVVRLGSTMGEQLRFQLRNDNYDPQLAPYPTNSATLMLKKPDIYESNAVLDTINLVSEFPIPPDATQDVIVSWAPRSTLYSEDPVEPTEPGADNRSDPLSSRSVADLSSRESGSNPYGKVHASAAPASAHEMHVYKGFLNVSVSVDEGDSGVKDTQNGHVGDSILGITSDEKAYTDGESTADDRLTPGATAAAAATAVAPSSPAKSGSDVGTPPQTGSSSRSSSTSPELPSRLDSPPGLALSTQDFHPQTLSVLPPQTLSVRVEASCCVSQYDLSLTTADDPTDATIDWGSQCTVGAVYTSEEFVLTNTSDIDLFWRFSLPASAQNALDVLDKGISFFDARDDGDSGASKITESDPGKGSGTGTNKTTRGTGKASGRDTTKARASPPPPPVLTNERICHLPPHSEQRLQLVFRPSSPMELEEEMSIENVMNTDNYTNVRLHAFVSEQAREDTVQILSGTTLDFGACCAGEWERQAIVFKNTSSVPQEVSFQVEKGVEVAFKLDTKSSIGDDDDGVGVMNLNTLGANMIENATQSSRYFSQEDPPRAANTIIYELGRAGTSGGGRGGRGGNQGSGTASGVASGATSVLGTSPTDSHATPSAISGQNGDTTNSANLGNVNQPGSVANNANATFNGPAAPSNLSRSASLRTAGVVNSSGEGSRSVSTTGSGGAASGSTGNAGDRSPGYGSGKASSQVLPATIPSGGTSTHSAVHSQSISINTQLTPGDSGRDFALGPTSERQRPTYQNDDTESTHSYAPSALSISGDSAAPGLSRVSDRLKDKPGQHSSGIDDLYTKPGVEYRVWVLFRPRRVSSLEEEPEGGRFVKKSFRVTVLWRPWRRKGGQGADQKAVVHCRARVCTSFISVYPKTVDFGAVELGTSRQRTISITNLSEIEARVDLRFISKVLSTYRDIIVIDGHATVDVRLDIAPRRTNPAYQKQISVHNILNPSNSAVCIAKSANIDTRGVSLHSLFYKLLTPTGGNFLDFGSVPLHAMGLRALTIQNTSDVEIDLGLTPLHPEDYGVYCRVVEAGTEGTGGEAREMGDVPSGEAPDTGTHTPVAARQPALTTGAAPSAAPHGISKELKEQLLDSVFNSPSAAGPKRGDRVRGDAVQRKKAGARNTKKKTHLAYLDLAAREPLSRVDVRPDEWTTETGTTEKTGSELSGPGAISSDTLTDPAITDTTKTDSARPPDAPRNPTLRLLEDSPEKRKLKPHSRTASVRPRSQSKARGDKTPPSLALTARRKVWKDLLVPLDRNKMSLDEVLGAMEQHSAHPDFSVLKTAELEDAYVRKYITMRHTLKTALRKGDLYSIEHVVLKPRSERTIYVIAKPSGTRGEVKNTSRSYDGKIQIRLNGLTKPLDADVVSDLPELSSIPVRELPLKWLSCRMSMDLGMAHISFGQVKVNGSKTKTIMLTNASEMPLLYAVRKSGSIASGDLKLPEGRHGVLASFSKRQISFTFEPHFTGAFEENVHIDNCEVDQDGHMITIKAYIL